MSSGLRCQLHSKSPPFFNYLYSSAGGGQECCYNANGALTSNQDEFDGGFAYRAHHSGVAPYKSPRKVPWLSHLVLDEYPRIQCCVSSDDPFFCKIYRQVRPPQSCAGYIQITPGKYSETNH